MTPRTKAPSLQPQTSGTEVPTRLSIPSSAETPTTRNEDTTNDDALWITLLNFAVTLQGTVSSTEVLIQALKAYLETTLSAQKVTLEEVSPVKIQGANSTEYEFSVTAWFTQGSVNEGLILEQQRAAFRDVAPVQAFLQVYFNASGSNGVTISSIEVMEEEEASNSRKTVLVIAMIVAASAWCCVLVFVIAFVRPRYRQTREQREHWKYRQEQESTLLRVAVMASRDEIDPRVAVADKEDDDVSVD
jgi:hypothetical protein